MSGHQLDSSQVLCPKCVVSSAPETLRFWETTKDSGHSLYCFGSLMGPLTNSKDNCPCLALELLTNCLRLLEGGVLLSHVCNHVYILKHIFMYAHKYIMYFKWHYEIMYFPVAFSNILSVISFLPPSLHHPSPPQL